jgi:hypothetical protein
MHHVITEGPSLVLNAGAQLIEIHPVAVDGQTAPQLSTSNTFSVNAELVRIFSRFQSASSR